MGDADADVRAIRELVQRQFASMTWAEGGSPDVAEFKNDFVANAKLYPSARPLASRSIDEFASRMCELASTSLLSFRERAIGMKVHVFGNVAVAVVACENTENETEVNRNVEMMLLAKNDGCWSIAAQAWEKETEARPIPGDLFDEV